MKCSSADEKNVANKAEFKEYVQRMPKAIQEKEIQILDRPICYKADRKSQTTRSSPPR